MSKFLISPKVAERFFKEIVVKTIFLPHHMYLQGYIQTTRSMAILLMSLLIMQLLTGCTGPDTHELSGHLLIVGSTALQPLASVVRDLFQKQYPQVHIDVQGGGSLQGLNAVTSHQADIGDSDVYADPAIYPDPNLTDHIICVIPFTMVVNPEVHIPSLTSQQIIDIFSTGKLHNWSQLGGPDRTIVPVVRPSTSGTRATFRKYILGGRDEKGKLLKTDSSTAVRDTVAQTPGGIGYLALSVLDSSVRAVAIDNYQPTHENIANGHYAYWSYEHMYTLGDSNALISKYLDFMFTPPAQKLAQQLGYIPITEMKIPSTSSLSNNVIALSRTQYPIQSEL
ncbi:MAG: phosphate ABC transporter substrate-binding protein [Chloroflexi bacterium]|nr:MAG: phosphate ABC transporter substrate-binding protein [Chloroflexota bacterium]